MKPCLSLTNASLSAGTMANGLNFWDELSKQIAELEEAKKKGIS